VQGEQTNLSDRYAIVACGTLRRELLRLGEEGFLNPGQILFTAPGLHEWPKMFTEQLTRQLDKARSMAERIIVVYGRKCYIDPDSGQDTDAFLARVAPEAVRIAANNCVDMLADAAQREDLAAGAKVYWLTAGWLEYWDFIFKDWDAAKANETFPSHDRAVLLDATGYFEQLAGSYPEKIVRISDWMRIEIEPQAVRLDRLKALLRKANRTERDGEQ